MGGSTPKSFSHLCIIALLVSVLVQLSGSVNGQSISTPCTSSMLSSFTPCLNYITGSSSNGTSPTFECCNSLKDLVAASIDCVCLLVTASVPLPQLVSRNLALSLPRICSISGVSDVPIQCEAVGSPLPAPGPAMFQPPPPPSAVSPQASKTAARDPLPEAPASPPAEVEVPLPPAPAALLPWSMPSGSSRSCPVSSTTLILVLLGFTALGLY